MKPSSAMAAGAAAAVVAITAAVFLGERIPEVAQDKRRASVHWADGGVPLGVKCLWTTALAEPSALGLFGLDVDAGAQYVRARVCAPPADGGDEAPSLPAGMLALQDGQTEEDFDGGAELTAVLQGEVEFECACSTGSNCEQWRQDYGSEDGGWAAAPRGNTLSAGKWRGAGCFRKACVEGFGWPSSWPGGCPRE